MLPKSISGQVGVLRNFDDLVCCELSVQFVFPQNEKGQILDTVPKCHNIQKPTFQRIQTKGLGPLLLIAVMVKAICLGSTRMGNVEVFFP